MIGRDEDPIRPLAINVDDFHPGKLASPHVWREFFTGDTKVKQTLDLRCDALSPASVAAARDRVDSIRIAWQSMIMQHIQATGTGPTPAESSAWSPRAAAGAPGSPRRQ